MYDIAISVIQEYIDEYLFEPAKNWPEEEFNARSCERWTANELLERITRETMLPPEFISVHPLRTPYQIIEEFINDMDYQAKASDNRKHYFIFSTARDTAIDIILLFV